MIYHLKKKKIKTFLAEEDWICKKVHFIDENHKPWDDWEI